MFRARVIPCLLLDHGKLVKGEKFKKHNYVGDPINAVRIFNEKQTDELAFFDISARSRGTIDYELIRDISSEAFMPFSYGGGISNMSQIEKLFHMGVEKVILNSSAYLNPQLVKDAVNSVGSQSVVVSIDVKKSFTGKQFVYINNGKKNTRKFPIEYAKQIEQLGAGELIVCSIEREGTGTGYDLELLKNIAEQINIPVVAVGGATSLDCFREVVMQSQVSAVGAGDFFVYHGRRKAVLITYPTYDELTSYIERR